MPTDLHTVATDLGQRLTALGKRLPDSERAELAAIVGDVAAVLAYAERAAE